MGCHILGEHFHSTAVYKTMLASIPHILHNFNRIISLLLITVIVRLAVLLADMTLIVFFYKQFSFQVENFGRMRYNEINFFCRVYSDCQTAEIEYCIGESFWGNGYAIEALSALIDYTFHNTDFVKLEAYHRAENSKSGRVLEKSAMHITDNVERFARENSLPHGEVCYCIEKDTFLMF